MDLAEGAGLRRKLLPESLPLHNASRSLAEGAGFEPAAEL